MLVDNPDRRISPTDRRLAAQVGGILLLGLRIDLLLCFVAIENNGRGIAAYAQCPLC